MENEELIRRRFQDMARRAYNRNIVVCSDFLDLHELHNLQYLNMDDLGVKLRLSGGYEEAERQIAAFLPDAFVYFEEDDFDKFIEKLKGSASNDSLDESDDADGSERAED